MDWNLGILSSQLAVIGGAVLLMLLGLLPRFRRSYLWPELLAAASVLIAAALTAWSTAPESAFGGRLLADGAARFLNLLFCGIGLSTILLSSSWLRREGVASIEYHVLLLFALGGMMTLVASADLVSLFIALEVLSLPLYVLAAYRRRSERSVEAGLKYFLLGAFASALMLMGIALLWGNTGKLLLPELARAWAAGDVLSLPLAEAGFWMVVVGLAFKVSVVPFHFWTADVYEGSPTPIVAFMATGTKIAALVALTRFLFVGFGEQEAMWQPVIAIAAIATMSIGNLMAIVQANIKRMLAFSSIAHAGYLLLALLIGGERGLQAMLFYLVAYAVMSLGAFGVVALVGRAGEREQSIYDYSGLARKNPLMAAMMSLFLLSLAGIPPALGFAGKLFLFWQAMDAGLTALVIVAVLNSLVSVYYYLRVIYLMTMKEEWEEKPALKIPVTTGIVLTVASLLILGLGLLPGAFWSLVGQAAVFY